MTDNTLTNQNSFFQRVINTFGKITSIELFFLSSHNKLVSSDILLNKSQEVKNYLTNLHTSDVMLFPVIINNELSGSFLLPKDRAANTDSLMLREYLESTAAYLSNQHNLEYEISVLSPIRNADFQTYSNELALIKETGNPLSKPLITPPTLKIIKTNHSSLPMDLSGDRSDIFNNIARALSFINGNISKQLTLEEVSQNIYLSPSYLSRIFKKDFNINFINYINTRKIALAQQKLALTSTPIAKVSKQVGFSQASYFTKIFKQKTGMPPSDYRKLNQKIQKIYTIPRNISWLNNPNAFEVSKQYFETQGISFEWRNINGLSYVFSIDGLTDSEEQGGWIYFVDCIQPTTPANKVQLADKSVIQWIYTENIH